ncbi:arsenite efflux transporter metallochaperone ArsD [Tessaracoccus sp. Y36]
MMNAIKVFEPPLCCNTGVCGTDVDQTLVDFAADVAWLKERGGAVTRANLASDPAAFAEEEAAKEFMRVAGIDGLPLVVVGGTTVLTGRYPDRSELARFAGVDEHPDLGLTAVTAGESGCCGGGGCCS